MEDRYELVEPFDIDQGELDGVTPQVVFCLGFEFCQFRIKFDGGGPLRETVHTENVSRLKRMCIRRGRKFSAVPCPGAETEWTFLDVADESGEFMPTEPPTGD